jgi:hypothetical protein
MIKQIKQNIYGEIIEDIDIMVKCECGGVLNARVVGDKVEIYCYSCEFYCWIGIELLDDREFFWCMKAIRNAIFDYELRNQSYNFSNVKKIIDSYISIIDAYQKAISD